MKSKAVIHTVMAVYTFFAVLICTAIIGWLANIFHIINMLLDHVFNMELAIRVVGIPIAPIGAIMGLFA